MNTVTSNQRPPSGIPQSAVDSQFNRQMAMALAQGDPRFSVKQYDRPGLSRSGAQWNQAGIDAAQRLADGITDAYSNRLQANVYNADTQLQGQSGQERFAQALGGLQQQNNYANQMAALQRQNTMMGMFGGLLRGLFD